MHIGSSRHALVKYGSVAKNDDFHTHLFPMDFCISRKHQSQSCRPRFVCLGEGYIALLRRLRSAQLPREQNHNSTYHLYIQALLVRLVPTRYGRGFYSSINASRRGCKYGTTARGVRCVEPTACSCTLDILFRIHNEDARSSVVLDVRCCDQVHVWFSNALACLATNIKV